MIEGRSCPLHYRRTPEALQRPGDAQLRSLIVAGGLYGNAEALKSLEGLAAEMGDTLCFNGDVHWFDADADLFTRVEEASARHWRTAGNVELELAAASGAGCGCAYPETVPERFVERSNRIMEALQPVVATGQRDDLAHLPLDARFDVGDLRVGVVHGDPESIAGWGLAVEAAEADPLGFRRQLADWFCRADVDVLACAHTCLPHARRLTVAGRECVLINNGSAGMGNFGGDPRGLVTRIAATPSPQALYRTRLGDWTVEAVPVAFELDAWREWFEALWPAGSAAALNYGARIVAGPFFDRERACGAGFEPG